MLYKALVQSCFSSCFKETLVFQVAFFLLAATQKQNWLGWWVITHSLASMVTVPLSVSTLFLGLVHPALQFFLQKASHCAFHIPHPATSQRAVLLMHLKLENRLRLLRLKDLWSFTLPSKTERLGSRDPEGNQLLERSISLSLQIRSGEQFARQDHFGSWPEPGFAELGKNVMRMENSQQANRHHAHCLLWAVPRQQLHLNLS